MTNISREQYLTEFAEHLVSKRYHPKDAQEFATMALDEMLDDEGIEYGDPSFEWTKGAGADHAFNWLDNDKYH